MIVTIGGTPGAGKDTVGKILSSKINYKYFAFGEILRELAKKEGIDIEELSSKLIHNPITDNQVDEFQEELGSTMNNIIVVSRLGFHFIPQSLKIYLFCEEEEGARRIISAERDTEKSETIEEALEEIRKRTDNDSKRYKKFYGIDIHDRNGYDIVINTTTISAEAVAEIVECALGVFEKEV